MHCLKMAHTVPKDLDGHVIVHVHVFNIERSWTSFEKDKKIWLFIRGS